MFLPDGLLTPEQTKHDVELNPHIIAPDPFASDDCLDDLSPVHLYFLNTTEEKTTMNSGADEPSSGLNGRLRPRKSNIPSPQSTKHVRKSDGKTGQDKAKRINAATKTPPNKTDDLATKSDTALLCPYCDKKFASKQTLSKHFRRMHGASSKQDSFIACLFCSHYEAQANEIVCHMAETHSQQYFACVNCHTRFSTSTELAEHKVKSCEAKLPYRSRLRQKVAKGSLKETNKDDLMKNESKVFSDGHSFNGIVISCELKPSQVSDGADIEDNITTNLILPPSKSLGSSNAVIEKSAVIVLDDIQWNKRIPPNFSFHNTDADQILSRLGVVHRSPRTGESTKKDWKNLDETTQKFEKCFDTSFYSKVASNVQENLSKFLDGSFNFNPDPDSTIKTRKSKNSVMINTAEGFPILLASEQYSRNVFDRYMPRAIAPKHKWKWDSLESEKSPINPDQIKRDSHTNNCIISLVSSLDIWTQLRMRRKFEEKFGCPPLEKKTEKQTIVSNELKDILESRELPTPSSQVMKMTKKAAENSNRAEFPACLGLAPATSSYELQPAVLSGEWVRPRCYVCCACGAQSQDSRAVSTHVSTHHPNAQVQHYEIVGEQLLNADILKHLYVPPSQMCNRTRPPRGFRECTKCKKSITLDDLHQHMLDCAGDTPAVRRKCRYRPFGVRRRRPRLPDNTIRKKIRKDIRTRQTRAKALMRPRPIRTEVGDAETIRKMIADLPAKRHRVLVNPTNTSLRPRIKQRPKILMKRRHSEDRNKRIKRNKESIETRPRPTSPTNDAMSIKSDEDNKPLKPKIRRVANKIPRRSETDKRKTTILTRAKRPKRQILKVEKKDTLKDGTDSVIDSKNIITENVSIDDSPQRININTEDFKAKKQAGQGQGNSNNHGRLLESNGQNDNSGNHSLPAQNVPLKHSIARLTADSEKHDKSVQFHHLFLIQQECNNINQHVQSGQQLLFENEAAVLTLDKPPLHCNIKGPIDALQRSKLNKPRKGLNACIAMLKNKLVEPVESAIPAGHVSVQCGDDEPLYAKPDTTLQITDATGANADIITKPDNNYEPSQDMSVSLEMENVKDKSQTTAQSSKKKQSAKAKREMTNLKSHINEDVTVELTGKTQSATQVNAPKSTPDPESAAAIPIKAGAPTQKDKQMNVESDNSKRQAKITEISNQHQLSLYKPQETSKCQILEDKQITTEDTKPSTSNHQTPTIEKKQSAKEQNSIHYLQQQTDYHLDSEFSRKVTAENFHSPEFNSVSVNNRPAHSSTLVESIISIPLDLSGKVTNVNKTHDSSNTPNLYLLGNTYDAYETLDLSNKTHDLGYRGETASTQNDEIVDLSIKTSLIKSTEVNILGKDVTDLSLASCLRLDVPTDLTVKKKVTDVRKQLISKISELPDSPPKQLMTSSGKSTMLPIVTKSNLLLSIDNEDKQATGLSVTPRADNINVTERVMHINELNTAPTTSVNLLTSVTENLPEKIIDSVPAHVLCQEGTKDVSNELSTRCLVSIAPGKTEHDANKNQDISSQMNLLIHDKTSIQIQRPVYDPTLKIPQYKIRASSTLENPSNIDSISPVAATMSASGFPQVPEYSEVEPNANQGVSDYTSEGKSAGVQNQETPYGIAPLDSPSSNTGSIYAIKNSGKTSHSSKFESTRAVYTLAKTCISVTKIESTNSTALTNTLLSIPGTTISNTTPVYTLAGTTIGVQANYSHSSVDPRNTTTEKKYEQMIPSTSSQSNKQYEEEVEIHKDQISNDNLLSNVDQDPETARKIALLPKELVDVLGNMPVDHRNRLLNILPQYVSTPTSDTGMKCELSSQTETSNKLTTLAELKENKISSTANNAQEPESVTTLPLFTGQQENKLLSSACLGTDSNVEHPTNMPLSHQNTSDTSLTIGEKLLISKDEHQNEKIKSDGINEDTFTHYTTNRLSGYPTNKISTEKVIDLTEDETISRTEIHNGPIVPPPVSLLVHPKRNKSNNDQTASLRAVRIKAPSARQKSIDNQLAKYTSMAPILSNKINDNEQDNEVEKTLHINASLNTDVSLAIQQAEISSTQHSNKNAAAECKFPSVTSPIIQESNLDETNSCTRRLSTASKDENVKIDDMQNVKSVVKTTLVTSSVVNNEINKVSSQMINKGLLDTKHKSMKADVSSLDNESIEAEFKGNLTTNTDSNLGTDLDNSESYDSPFQCSTPKAVIGNVTENAVISQEHLISIASKDQEDSDDDLSLAVICQQKRENFVKESKANVNKSNNEAGSSVKKKEKKNKKNVENVNETLVSSLSNNNTATSISVGNEKQARFTETEKYEQPTKTTTDENIKQNNRKLRRKNVVNYTQSKTSDATPKIVHHNLTVDKNKDDDVRIKDDEGFNTILKDDNKQSISTSRKRSKINDDIVTTESIKERSTEKNTNNSKSKALAIRQRNKKKKKIPIVVNDSVHSDITLSSSSVHETNNDTNVLDSNRNDTNIDEDVVGYATNKDLKEIGLEDKHETAIFDTSGSHEHTNTENNTLSTTAVPLTSGSRHEDLNNMTTPLRRSRRGRSHNNSVVVEKVHVDSMQETRTPLTKKQLIFSKLLLDEENNIKKSEFGTGDGNTIESLKSTAVSETKLRSLIQEPYAVDNFTLDRNKSVKRKKSPILKRKCKKKKSVNAQIVCIDEIFVSESEHAKSGAVTSEDKQKPFNAPEQSCGDSKPGITSTSVPASEIADTSNIRLNDDLEVSIEKRKSDDMPYVDLSQSSQPKKIKSNITEYCSDIQSPILDNKAKIEKECFTTRCSTSNINATLDFTTNTEKNVLEEAHFIPKLSQDEEKHVESKLNESDIRMKTCYNTPAAGRRTRSKSAVIKSTVYDPYDIDMDDMIEHAEPLRQRKTSSEYRSYFNITKQSICSKETENLAMSGEDIKNHSSHEFMPVKNTLDSKHDGSDSDDSSKSDIPLKKYVTEKEKKICDLNETRKPDLSYRQDMENEIASDLNDIRKQRAAGDKKNRRTLGVSNTDDHIPEDETEQQLRSEQFMESFGFFSERKPRKSNLLATKKISETFHIIANESDDMYFGFKDRNSKKSTQTENRKSSERETNLRGSRQRSPLSRKTVKRGRKKKDSTTVTAPSYCHICKKEFRRSDNFLRHQMTLLHVSKMSEVEMKIKTVPIQEEPNYLIAYKEHLDRLKIITDKMLKRKKNSKSTPKIAPLSLEEILADVNKIVREQQLSHRGLSCDEELFLDCCELLKESHKKQDPVTDIPTMIKDSESLLCTSQAANVGLDLLGKTDIDVKSDSKNDGDVDSITAKTILESEEVRNLENDLISGLKEAANASSMKKSGIVFQPAINEVNTDRQQDFREHFSSPAVTESQFEQVNNYVESVEMDTVKNKKYPEFKEKMYPDIEEIDMFEDKFDKIKRKCRSQAAAAKQPRLVVEPSINRQGRKRSDKKKGKKNSKKNHPNTVLTKGALKGFDGIKVSIPTSDINISAIVSPLDGSHKKKRKGISRKRRENKNSESSCKYDSDHPPNVSSASLKNVDVYEFMDNEDVELFEFRPSTLMERFKSITNKDTPSTSKVNPVVDEADNSSISASDGDDFVYMSDDYVCSDDETENSLMSCDVNNTKNPTDIKKMASQMKKRDAIEKNAVMGKIFKNNAVRGEKKMSKSKEPAKPKANLDQLFDSLLEDEPTSSMLNDDSPSIKDEAPYASKYENKKVSPGQSEEQLSKYEQYHMKKKYNSTIDKEHYSSKYKNSSSDNDEDDEISPFNDYGPSSSKLCLKSFIGDHKSTKPGLRPSLSPPELIPVSPKKYDSTSMKQNPPLKKNERMSLQDDDEDTENFKEDGMKKSLLSQDDRAHIPKIDEDVGFCSDYNEIEIQALTSDETGVARQRARRKCTVGKQNILAETWSSESEPDGGPPRPNSAESMASGTTRKKKGKKKDGQHTGGRRTNNRHISFKKQEIVSRVSSNIRNTSSHTNNTSSSGVVNDRSTGSTLGSFVPERSDPSTSAASTSGGTYKTVEEPPAIPSTSSGASTICSPIAGPSTSSGCVAAEPTEPTFLVPAEPGTSGGVSRFRTLYYWSSDGGDEEQAREGLAREELARAALARDQQAREVRDREEEAQQQQQQHGWIVGDSHKKLVTMLAHAKGRKRNNNNDDKRHKTE